MGSTHSKSFLTCPTHTFWRGQPHCLSASSTSFWEQGGPDLNGCRIGQLTHKLSCHLLVLTLCRLLNGICHPRLRVEDSISLPASQAQGFYIHFSVPLLLLLSLLLLLTLLLLSFIHFSSSFSFLSISSSFYSLSSSSLPLFFLDFFKKLKYS